VGRQLASEWIKLRSLNSTWLMVGLGVVGIVLQAVIALITVKDHSSEELALGVMSGSGTTLIIIVLLGVTTTAAEYSQKSIITTYTVTPKRWRVLVAKAILVAGVGVALGLISVPLSRLVAAIWFAFGEGTWDASFGTAVHYAIGTMVGYAGFAVLGAMIGALARSPALGVGIGFGLLFATSAASLTLLDPDNRAGNQPLFGSAIALLALYVVILSAITWAVEDRRDVHA